MKHIPLVAAFAFAACSPAAEQTPAPAPADMPDVAATPAPSPTSTDTLTSEGWGPLRIGMTKDEVTAAAGADSNPGAVGGPDPESCDEYRPANAPEGLMVMIQDGKLTRISLVELSSLKTDKGLGIGDTAEAVKSAYGTAATSTPHKYQDAPAAYITAWTGSPRTEPYVEDPAARGIVYEIDGTGKVGAIHAGDPSIQYVEGCA